jgi:Adenylate kinase, active site lid
MSDWPFFNCPKCKALYHVVKVADLSPTEGTATCRLCGEPLPDREGPYILKYFLLPRRG